MTVRSRLRRPRVLLPAIIALWMGVLCFTLPEAASPQVAGPAVELPTGHPDTMFVTSHECGACHNG